MRCPVCGCTLISIHALLAESDQLRSEAHSTWNQFLSTLSLRRATHQSPHLSPRLQFLSTLSLRRATQARFPEPAQIPHFYPRSPCGERLEFKLYFINQKEFLSTLSLRRATSSVNESTSGSTFLSTLSLRRATDSLPNAPPKENHFYPRSPCGERPRERASIKPIFRISIHALLAESDPGKVNSVLPGLANFYPRSPCGERLSAELRVFQVDYFYPRSPCGERHKC